MVWLGCLPQILFGPFLNTLTHMKVGVHSIVTVILPTNLMLSPQGVWKIEVVGGFHGNRCSEYFETIPQITGLQLY